MNEQKTTIVVLSYNRKEITEKFLELLFKYTDPQDFKLIMIDNGSTDGTQDYLNQTFSKFDNHTLILNNQNLGVIGGRNMGYTFYQSDPTDYFILLDNDQFVREGWLNQYLDFMTKGQYDVIGADAWLMDKTFMPRYNCKKAGEPYTYVGCGGMMIKREVLDKIGLFDEQFNPAFYEDPDFNFRARKANFRIGWNSGAKIDHLAHQTLGKNPDRMKLFEQSYNKFKKKWKDCSFPPIR